MKGLQRRPKVSADNWFAAEITESNSLMFMAFVEEENRPYLYEGENLQYQTRVSIQSTCSNSKYRKINLNMKTRIIHAVAGFMILLSLFLGLKS